MYPGLDPEGAVREVLRRQEEIRERAWMEAEARRAKRPSLVRGLAAFRLWRLHVMVWVERAPRA